MNTNRAFLKLLSAVLFAVLVISLSASMINEVSASINANGVRGSDSGIIPVIDRSGGSKVPGEGDGGLAIGDNGGAGGALGSNNYLIIAIVGIVIVVTVLLVVKVVIPKLRAK